MALTTVSTREQAHALARAMVERRLAACVQLEPVESVYHWDGALQQDAEVRLLLKTTAARWPALCEALRALHPYTLPQILALPVADALPAFARWVGEQTSPPANAESAS
ncbi:MAG: divalent-cation tolerance protein CutA [Burkholderiales bacterium]|nr:divalent-cation tolerance protein CutA [Burkholderiales bacterium]